MILEDVIEEHAEEASFLWHQRDAAIRAPDYDINELAHVDSRVEAHLDGLRIAGTRGWEICKEIGWDQPGEFFTGMSLAIFSGRAEAVGEVLDAAEDNPEATRAVISAYGWAEPQQLRGLVKLILEDANPFRRQVAIGACAVHRVNPGKSLPDALADPHAGLRARALKACGELGVVKLLSEVEPYFEDEDDECRFWAAWSAGLLGSNQATRLLGLFAGADNPRRRQALNLVIRLMEPPDAQLWLRALVNDPAQLRWALIGSGIQGDPSYLQPLMRQFEIEALGRVAGEAFEMITGLNMFRESLEIIPEVPEPELQAAQDDNEDVDDDEDLGEDLGLVMPNSEKMTPWYEANKDRFQAGQRYLCGQPISTQACQGVLSTGQQRQRQAAALEIALATPGRPLFETRAPAERQAGWLAAGQV